MILALVFASCFSSEAWPASENDFYRELNRKPSATNADVVHAVARFKGYRGNGQWDAHVDFLASLGIAVGRRMLKTPNAPVTKGDAAMLLLNAMDDAADQRGLLGRFFTRSRRFAARDGMAQKLLPSDSYMGEFLSGADLLAMLSRAVEQSGEKTP